MYKRQTLESYIVRRMLVRATTKNYNRLFTSLILNEAKDAAALRTALAADAEATTYMPSDPEVRAAFGESCLYNLQSKGVLYLLESAIRPSMSSTALLGFKCLLRFRHSSGYASRGFNGVAAPAHPAGSLRPRSASRKSFRESDRRRESPPSSGRGCQARRWPFTTMF